MDESKESVKDKTRPKVEIFGEEIHESSDWERNHWPYHHYHDGSGSIIWGFILILAGFVFLLNNLGILPLSIWNGIWHFWPILIVLIGVDVLLGRSWISRIITFLITLSFFATLIGVILLKTSPNTLVSLPPNILIYLNNVSNILFIK